MRMIDIEAICGVGIKMSRIQNFAIGLLMAALGVAAFFQVIHVDPIWRLVSIGIVGIVAAFGAAVFFAIAIADR